MSVHELQRARLSDTVRWAQSIREHLQPILGKHRGKVHFRPSSGGVAMVGLTPERPQRGKSGIRNLKKLATDFDAEFRKHCVQITQGKPVPEKALQSWLLAEAYMNGRRMVSLNDASDSNPSPAELVFVTDEIAIPTTADGEGRIVCDILALRVDEDGEVPVAIELKTKRQLTRLIEQVTGYAALVDHHRALIAELFTATLGRPVSFSRRCERWIVWPRLGDARDPREDELANVGIRVVGYEQKGTNYEFRVGKAPLSGPKVALRQVYLQPGIEFPFSHIMQRWITNELSRLTTGDEGFAERFGADFTLCVNLSAKSAITVNEVLGPTVFRSTNDVEYTLFLPFDVLARAPQSRRETATALVAGLVSVLAAAGLPTAPLRKRAAKLTEHLCNSPDVLNGAWELGSSNS